MGSATSFGIITTEDLSNIKHFGLNLIESGNYKKDMFKVNVKKINITKPSWVILIILIILYIFLLIK